SSRRRHTRSTRDWSSDVCSSDLTAYAYNFSMNRLSADKRKAVVAALSEGNSLRATARMTGVARNTISKLLLDLGTVCSVHQDHRSEERRVGKESKTSEMPEDYKK